jgi:ectoine hydroxylase-related dioxygenase (phytanoyl-CoA dioxygenase family)
MTGPSRLEQYLFDLRGYLVIEGALGMESVVELNEAIDRFPQVGRGEWIGNSQRRDYTADTGFELHNMLDCGDQAFDVLIDHPSWIEHARCFAGESGTYVEGVTIDECIASVRGAGGHHPVHSGAFNAAVRTQYGYRDGVFRCGQLNVLIALTDIGPGDGATMVVPGSHKSNMAHPLAGDYLRGDRMDALPGAIEVHMRAGDALLFVDSIMHGAGSRTTVEGERRVLILRYGPTWAKSRFGYTWSQGLLHRLSPAAHHILQPVPPIHQGDPMIPREAPRTRPHGTTAT